VIRSFAKNKAALSKQYGKAVESGALTFSEIPDMTVPNAFHELAKKSIRNHSRSNTLELR